MENGPLVTNDAIVLGMLMAILGFVFWSSSRTEGFWKKFYTIVPALLVCYFAPSVLGTVGIISADQSALYFVASRYLLPTSLVLLTLSMDLGGIFRLGPKAVIMFLTGTTGIVIGGPIAMMLVGMINPDIVGGEGPDAVWRGLSTVAGSWIGGGANQAAMKEMWGAGDDLFSAMIAVDVIVANIWMAYLLYAAARAPEIDKRRGADVGAIEALKKKMVDYQKEHMKIPALSDTVVILAVGFAVTALAHAGAGFLGPLFAPYKTASWLGLGSKFFWLIVLATTGGVILSYTRARKLEGVGASRIGSVFIYVLVATIGMNMNLMAIFEYPWMFLVGGIWIAIHGALLILVARLIRAPMFYLAVGSQANVGGAASAPVVASAFHPSLATVGVLLAVAGYALGTYAAWLCAVLMQWVAS